MWEMILDCVLDALKDGAVLLPFLFVTFLIIESMEHHTEGFMHKLAAKSKKTGPLWGSALGLVPQCGFSVMSANMYGGGVITLGTLIAIFLATSDEALIIMLGNPDAISKILPLLACKFVIGCAAGFAIDAARNFKYRHHLNHDVHEHHLHDLCDDCGCEKYEGVLRPALFHTVKLFAFIFIFVFIINVVIELIGEQALSRFLLSGTIFQPFLTALIGLIPNCAASVLITELFITGSISFGSALAGLLAGAGLGLAILFKMHKCTKKNLLITGLLYAISVVCGIAINLFA